MINGNVSIQAISPKDLLTYLCLRRYKNSNTGESSVSIDKIVKQTKTSPVTVLESIRRLEETGHISCHKKGRANHYGFRSNINAKSYAFLDEDISRTEKTRRAVEVAFSEDMNNDDVVESNLYGYVVRLEEDIVWLKQQVRTFAAELDRTRKYMSVITGQEYVPLVLPEKL